MKKVSAAMVTVIIIILFTVQTFGQKISLAENMSVIEPYRLAITFNKTTNLVFPFAIKSADRGSKDVLVQKAAGAENILQVKAVKRSFDETNITVITADGKLYSYIVNYADNPSVLNISFKNNSNDQTHAFFSPAQPNEAEVQANAENVVKANRNIKGVKDKKFGIKLHLDAIYLHDEVMYYRINIQNNSNINYDIEQLRFFIRDQKNVPLLRNWKFTPCLFMVTLPLLKVSQNTFLYLQFQSSPFLIISISLYNLWKRMAAGT